MLQVEKNIPVPQHLYDPLFARRKYPFHILEVGDSFRINTARKSAVSTAVNTANRKAENNERFAFDVDKTDGFRVWRIA